MKHLFGQGGAADPWIRRPALAAFRDARMIGVRQGSLPLTRH
ncbi:hypothetical protein ACU6P3_21350 [Streptomyces hebeiensis]